MNNINYLISKFTNNIINEIEIMKYTDIQDKSSQNLIEEYSKWGRGDCSEIGLLKIIERYIVLRDNNKGGHLNDL